MYRLIWTYRREHFTKPMRHELQQYAGFTGGSRTWVDIDFTSSSLQEIRDGVLIDNI